VANRGRRAKGEGALYRRKDGRWVGELNLGYEGGHRQRHQFYGRTQAEVLAKLNEAKRRLATGRTASDSTISLARYLQGWLHDTIDPSSLKPSTKASYRYVVESHILPVLGQVRLDKLRPVDVQRLLKTKREEKYTDRTRQLVHATLRRALGDAQRLDLVARNVASNVAAPRPQRDSTKVHPLTLDQTKALLATAAGTRLHALWLVLVLMGLRKGEALALTWTDIDMTTGTMQVQRTLSRVKGQGLDFGLTKSQYSRRASFIPPLVFVALQAHWAAQELERARAGTRWEDQGLVFTTSTGKPIEPSNLNRQFATLTQKAGIGHERVHNLRHTAATLLRAYGGADLHDVKEILGHSTIAVTSDLYGHGVPVVQRELMNRVSDLFEASGTARLSNRLSEAVTEPEDHP
jgi:integrase